MKTLFLIRHAKSSWTDINQKDFERPLDGAGITTAHEMAANLSKNTPAIDLFISSPAARTTETCKIFCRAFSFNENEIVFVPNLYEGSEKNYEAALSVVSDKHKQVALVGHNPGITYFANRIVPNKWIENIPACGIIAVESDCTSWKDFVASPSRLLFMDFPPKDLD